MPRGVLEVILARAKGLPNAHFLKKMDSYVILTYKAQESKSSVAKGSDPTWNESFLFNVIDDVSELNLRFLDNDSHSDDDYLGETTIPLGDVFNLKLIGLTAYNVVKEDENKGEVHVALRFNPLVE